MRILLSFLSFYLLATFSAQSSSDSTKLTFAGDFRFRVEQDWNSMKSSGAMREDRTRMRYRVRLGAEYELKEWAKVGIRLRTGDPRKQQDPQVTLGTGAREFGLLPLGFEKAFFKAERKGNILWLGKNSFPFKKNNELFWSDNVFPEGIFLSKNFKCDKGILNSIGLGAGHFILSSAGAALEEDAYLQGAQLTMNLADERIAIHPALYLLKNVANSPDGGGTYTIDYAIADIGASVLIHKESGLKIDFDLLSNLSDYASEDSIPMAFRDQTDGYSVGLGYGRFKKKGDWTYKVTYTQLERYAILDYMAQNDWARWDYSGLDSPDGRLSNFKGAEIVIGHMFDHGISLKMKYYNVEQLLATGTALENGQRVRLDLDVRF